MADSEYKTCFTALSQDGPVCVPLALKHRGAGVRQSTRPFFETQVDSNKMQDEKRTGHGEMIGAEAAKPRGGVEAATSAVKPEAA